MKVIGPGSGVGQKGSVTGTERQEDGKDGNIVKRVTTDYRNISASPPQ